MRINFQTPELQKRLGQLVAVVARKSQENIYTNVRVFSADGAIYLQGADSDSTLTVKLSGATVEPADSSVNVLLEYKRFNDIVQKLNAPTAALTVKDDGTGAVLNSARHRSNYACQPTDPFLALAVITAVPKIEDLALDGIVLPLPGLKEQLEQIFFAIPKVAGKFVSEAALIEAGNGRLTVVATDGKMMAVTTVKNELLTASTSMTVAKPALELLAKLDGGTTVKIVDMECQFVFATEFELLTHGKTHSEFPSYARIFPKPGAFKSKIVLKDKDALTHILERLKPSCFDDIKTIIFTAAGNGTELVFTAIKTDKQSTGDIFTDMGDEVAEVEVVGTDDVKFLLDISRLKQFTDRAKFPVTILFGSSTTILDLHDGAGTQEEPSYRFLVLPVRDDGPSSTPAAPTVKAVAAAKA
jgi:DNA polymerase III sliding clamp (beta) subunit (PCNA family)